MKKILVLFLMFLSLSISSPVYSSDLDLESMNLEDLLSLRERINDEVIKRSGDDLESSIIRVGRYEVGKQIKAGSYTFKALSSDTLTLEYVFLSQEDYEDYKPLTNAAVSYGKTVGINLEEGQLFVIGAGYGLLQPIEYSWTP